MGSDLASGLRYQGVGRRFVAILIDSIVLFIVAWILALATGGSGAEGFNLTGGPAFLWFLVVLAYYVLMEAYVGATLGKLVMGMRVLKTDGSRCDLQSSLIRNVLRIVDGIFAYLIAAILIWTSQKRQRLGDRVANTVVVRPG